MEPFDAYGYSSRLIPPQPTPYFASLCLDWFDGMGQMACLKEDRWACSLGTEMHDRAKTLLIKQKNTVIKGHLWCQYPWVTQLQSSHHIPSHVAFSLVFTKQTSQTSQWYECVEINMSCTDLFVVFDLIVEDNAVGSFWLLPGQGDTAPRRLFLSDHCYWGGSCVGDGDRHESVKRKRERLPWGSVEVQSPGVTSWQLSMVPVSLIQL